ncbi:MAG: Si-specific NAD(P)(+) transhydrogenase [Gammaproteobacteria bacterium]|nr:Si-specific NAD(P)(+) transhydrogenase [Gammaproteobacteria bacterium]
MAEYNYDLLVIGSGPAGEGAVISAAKAGKRVAVIERKEMIGGNCAHKGTVPSKSLRFAVKQVIRYNTQSLFRSIGDPQWVSYPKIQEAAAKVIAKQVDKFSSDFARNRVAVHLGQAAFVDKNRVEVTLSDGAKEYINAANVMITTGSRPYRPENVDFTHPRVYDSDTILKMQHTPRTMIVYGAGVIGCEYASIFAGLGIKVDLINTRDRLLSFLDDEISDALSYHLRDSGVMVRHCEEFESVTADQNIVTMQLQSGKQIKADALLWCNGRTGNTDGLGLENIGLEVDHRGQLQVSERYETSVEGIYAAGDVIGWPSLASASFDQGRAAARAICGQSVRFVSDAPTGIYTLPEISSLGKTERELTEARVPYEVGRAFFKHTARGQISGEDVGMLKLLFRPDSLEILGIHCFGAEAAEIIHIGQAIMSQKGEGNSIKFFVRNTFNYPTMAEAYRIAALNGLNRLLRF